MKQYLLLLVLVSFIVVFTIPSTEKTYGYNGKVTICYHEASLGCNNTAYYFKLPEPTNVDNTFSFNNCPDGWAWKYQASNFTMICYNPSSASGEANTASNIGHATGSFGWYVSKSGVNLNFMNFSSISPN